MSDVKILRIEPPNPYGGGRRFTELCRFDVEISPDCRRYGLRLVQASSGRRLTHTPSQGGRRLATFSDELASEITAEAGLAFDGYSAPDVYRGYDNSKRFINSDDEQIAA